MRFLRVALAAPGRLIPELAAFYGEGLGLAVAVADGDPAALSLEVGETTLDLVAGPGEPFHHVAFLVPGNRFEAARDWAARRVGLLAAAATGEVVFDFTGWDAAACYFHDPAGNIVELIAHRRVDESTARGPFDAAELVGLSELGLVGDPPAMAALLADGLGLELWDGTVEAPGRLGFVGERARTLILAPPGRGWLPTGRPAEPHPVRVVLAGTRTGAALLEDGRYRIASAGASGAAPRGSGADTLRP